MYSNRMIKIVISMLLIVCTLLNCLALPSSAGKLEDEILDFFKESEGFDLRIEQGEDYQGMEDEDLETYRNVVKDFYDKLSQELQPEELLKDEEGYYINRAITTNINTKEKFETGEEKSSSSSGSQNVKVYIDPFIGQYMTAYQLPVAMHLGTGKREIAKDLAKNMIENISMQQKTISLTNTYTWNTTRTITEDKIVKATDPNTGLETEKTEKVSREVNVTITETSTKSIPVYILQSAKTWGLEYSSKINSEDKSLGEATLHTFVKTDVKEEIRTDYLSNLFDRHELQSKDMQMVMSLLLESNNSKLTGYTLKLLTEIFPEYESAIPESIRKLEYKNADIEVWEYILQNAKMPEWNDDTGEYIDSIGYGNALEEYIKSWENSALWENHSSAVGKYITSDGKNYIVYYEGTINGNVINVWNISYGLNIGNHGNSGGGHAARFAKRGVDVTTLYREGAQVSKEIADEVFSEDIQARRESIKTEVAGCGLEEYQIDALVNIKYKRGNIGGFTTWYYNEYLKNPSGSREKWGPFQSGDSRRDANWKLFTEGIYTARNGTIIPPTGNFLVIAAKLHKLIERNGITTDGFDYSVTVLPNTYENITKPPYTICCATYVSWVLYEAGFKDGYQSTPIHSSASGGANSINGYCESKGFQKITSFSDLKAGDIVLMSTSAYGAKIGHVQIYAGDNKWFNTGSNSSIKNASPQYQGIDYARSRFKCAYRLP